MESLTVLSKTRGRLPVFSYGHSVREGAEAGHSGFGHIIHHPVNVLLQQDVHVTGHWLKWLPVLNDGQVGQDTLHEVSGQIQLVDCCVIKTHWRTFGGGGGGGRRRGLDFFTLIKHGQLGFDVFSLETHKQNALHTRRVTKTRVKARHEVI